MKIQSRRDLLLQAMQTEYLGYHPLISILRIAHHEAAIDDLRLQFDCHKTIARYIEPELKSVEVKAEVDERRKVIISMFDEDILDNDNDNDILDYDELQALPAPEESFIDSCE